MHSLVGCTQPVKIAMGTSKSSSNMRINRGPTPSLSQMGKLRGGNKSDLVKCLPKFPNAKFDAPNAVILDGAVVVQMLPPSTAGTFEEYFDQVFRPYLLRQLVTATRVDVVFDVYIDGSLKQSSREKRGSGQRRRVPPPTRIPTDWKRFLRVDGNKSELFSFLAKKVTIEKSNNFS